MEALDEDVVGDGERILSRDVVGERGRAVRSRVAAVDYLTMSLVAYCQFVLVVVVIWYIVNEAFEVGLKKVALVVGLILLTLGT